MEADRLGKMTDDVREILERIAEGAPRRYVGLPKPRQVRSDQMKPVRELWHELAEHVARRGKAVQQQDGWRVLGPGFAIENSDAVDIHLPVCDRAQRNPFALLESV